MRRSSGGGMSFFGIVFLEVFTGLMLMSYFSVVTQNLVFTHATLAAADISYYDSTGGSGHPSLLQVQRFGFEWWVFATDTLRIVPPIFALIFMCFCLIYGPTGAFLYTFVMAIFVVLELGKLGWRSWEYARCGFYQFCRNLDPAGTASSANSIWVTMFFFNLGFFLLSVIYAAVGGTLASTNSGGQYYELSSQTPAQQRTKPKATAQKRTSRTEL